MVSLDDNTSLSPNRGKLLYQEEFENNSSSKKRKLDEYSQQAHDQEVNSKKMFPSKHDNDDDDDDDDMSSILNTPFPMDWQRCLDIKSGQIYLYNTRTQKGTSKDPRTSPSKPPSHGQMSLDLELNLPCGSSPSNPYVRKFSCDDSGKNSGSIARSPSWLNFEEGDNKEEEMVTTVCNKCHMLVMMFKSSPSCPNCKFIYPPHQSPPNIFNRTSTLSLLC